jgi:hypothetical protein
LKNRRREVQRCGSLAQEDRDGPSSSGALSVLTRKLNGDVSSGGFNDPAPAMDRPCQPSTHCFADDLGVAPEFWLVPQRPTEIGDYGTSAQFSLVQKHVIHSHLDSLVGWNGGWLWNPELKSHFAPRAPVGSRR